jgi:hypothetical protein
MGNGLTEGGEAFIDVKLSGMGELQRPDTGELSSQRPHLPAGRGPTFLFIGAGRTGSNWFFEVLREHPGIFIPPNKGTFFFSRRYDLGLPWYEAFFPAEMHGRAVGEVCEDYLCSADALHRIKAYRPDIKLICCLRNPYERALSAWRFFGRNGLAEPTLAAQAACQPDVFYQGHYATHMQLIRSLFQEGQVLVYLYEDLVAPEDVVRRLYEFVGVDRDFVPPSLRRRVNVNARARSMMLARFVHNVHVRAWGSSRWLSNAVGRIKRFRPLRRLVTALLYDERPPFADWMTHLPDFPDEVVLRYEREISALERLLSRDLSRWHAPAEYVAPRASKAG